MDNIITDPTITDPTDPTITDPADPEEGQQGLTKEDVTKLIAEALKGIEKDKKKKGLEGLDAEQRKQAETSQAIQDLQEELSKYKLANTKAEISKVLNSRGLDAGFADFIVTSDDEEECLEKINSLEKLFKKAVKSEVDKRLKNIGGKIKGSEGSTDYGTITKEQFKRMSVSEQNEIFTNNRELYMELIKK